MSINKIMIITGASRGIGAATARLAAARGYAVCINYLKDIDSAEKVRAEIESGGGTAMTARYDVSREEEAVALFEAVDEQLGQVTALVNNAGILETQMRVDEIDGGRLQRLFAANLFSAFYCSREAVKRMSSRSGGNGGAIVNVSSAASRLGSPGEYVDYAATKGAMDTLTIGLSKEVAGEGIRVNAVRPAFIYTDMHASGGEPDRVDRISSTLPMQRGGTADEVANAILWLLSEEASYTTGTFIDLAGGK